MKISHQTKFDPTTTHSVGAKLWKNTPKFITDISEQTAFKEELIKLYGNLCNDETWIYINISPMELHACGCIVRILEMNKCITFKVLVE